MTEVIGVRFKSGSKTYYFDPRDLQVDVGTNVIIETARGIEFGTCTEANHSVEDSAVVQPLRPVVRIATPEDEKAVAELRAKEKKAFNICEEKIAKHGLDMKLVEVEYNFEGNKILFFFTSDGRVDFRELVKDLASVFRTRIELRQIGVRDEAKLLGGLGICGRPFCCASFLDDFQPVSIKMAKTQNLSLNPTKISGTCGRLMCCLKYEQEAYEDLVRRMPKVNTPVETPDGTGTVAEVNLLRQQVKVRFEGQPDKHAYRYDSETKSCRAIEAKVEPDSRFTSNFLSELLDSAPTLAETQKKDEREEPREHRRSSSNRRRGGKGGDRPAGEPRPQPKPQPKAEPAPTEAQPAGEEHKKSNHRRRRKKSGGNGEPQAPQSTAPQTRPQGEPKPQEQSGRSQNQQGQQNRPPRSRQNNRPQGDKPQGGRPQGERAQQPRPPKPQGEPRPQQSAEGGKPTEGGEHRRRSGNNKYRGRASNRPPKPETDHNSGPAQQG